MPNTLQNSKIEFMGTASGSEATPGSGRKHLPELDGLRGAAILMVMACHYAGLLPIPGILGRVTTQIMGQGWIGVNLFFVLSGFLITGILVDSKGQPHYFRNFYLRRSLRIFPLYYGFLVLVLLIGAAFWIFDPGAFPHYRILRDLAAYQPWLWTYTANVEMAINGFMALVPHFWSLSVEEQFYFIWPVLIVLLSRRGLKSACLSILAIALAIRLGMTLAGIGWLPIYVLTPTQMDSLAAGALVAIVAREPGGLARLRPAATWLAISAAGLFILWGLLLKVGHLRSRAPVYSLTTNGAHLQGQPLAMGILTDISYTVVALFFACVLLLGISSASPVGMLQKALTNRPLRAIGGYSYGIYVFHYPVMVLLEVAVGRSSWGPRVFRSLPMSCAFLLANVIITFGLAFLSFHLYEKRFLRLKRHFPETVVNRP